MIKSVVVPPKKCEDLCSECSYNCEDRIKELPIVDEVYEKLEEVFGDYDIGKEKIFLEDALDRILAEDVFSKIDIPNATCAMHDGIAVDYMNCVKRFNKGNRVLSNDEFFFAPMGTPIPEKFDTLLHAEQCKSFGDGSMMILELPKQYQSITLKGRYLNKNEKLAKVGEILTESHLALFQYSGNRVVTVKKKPKLTIIPVGNDLVKAGSIPNIGEHIECNSIYISSMAKKSGGEATVTPILKDNEDEIIGVIKNSISDSDIIVLIGGIGKGEDRYGDYTTKVVRNLGDIIFHGVQVGPGGKNMLLGKIEGKPIIGIPGPPHAAIIMTEYFIPKIISIIQGKEYFKREELEVILENDLPSRGGDEYIWEPRMNIMEENGIYKGSLVKNMGETVENFVTANASIIVTGGKERYKKGNKVKVKLLHRRI